MFLSSTADILLNFSEHPPLKLPTEGFILDFESGPSDPSFYHYLDAVKQAINPGNKLALKMLEKHRLSQRLTCYGESEICGVFRN